MILHSSSPHLDPQDPPTVFLPRILDPLPFWNLPSSTRRILLWSWSSADLLPYKWGCPTSLLTYMPGPHSVDSAPLSPGRTEQPPRPPDSGSFSGVSNFVINNSSSPRRTLPWVPTSGPSFSSLQTRRLRTAFPAVGHCSRPQRGLCSFRSPAPRGHRFWASPRLLRSPRSSSDAGSFSRPPHTHSIGQCVRQDVGRASPASRRTTGHCPQFPPNLGIVPGSSNGLGVAPGHWGLPPGSRSPSARPPLAVERSLAASTPPRPRTQPRPPASR